MEAQQLLELARACGAEAAEVYLSTGLERTAHFEANRLKQVESGEEQGVALRLWRDGRPGLAVARGDCDPRLLVDKALALSAFGQPETPELTSEPAQTSEIPLDAVSLELLIGWGEQAIAEVRERYPEVLCSCSMSEESGTVRLINSAGLDVSHSSWSRSGSLAAEWVRGDDFLQVYEGQVVQGTPDPAVLSQAVRERLGWAEKSASPAVGAVPVVFTARAADVLLGAALAALNGRQVLQKASPWSTRRGEPVLSPLITLSQDPKLGPYALPFDDEGTPTAALDFVTAGTLATFYADRRTARALDLPLTGNGLRDDLGSFPQPGLFHLVVAPGEQSFAELLALVGDGILVDQVLGGGASLSGEFSVNIDLGFRVKKGEIVGRVKDTMVTGNAYDALNRLVALSAERSWEGSLLVPSLLVEALAVTGRSD